MTANTMTFKSWFVDRYPLFAYVLFDHRERGLVAVSIGAIATYALTILYILTQTTGGVTPNGVIFGGDFSVFWAAAQAFAQGDAALIYDSIVFDAKLQEHFPQENPYLLSWQYPPTMFLALAPLSALPYLPALFLWWAFSLAIFVYVLRTLWPRRSALIIALGSAAIVQGLITGQTGLFTASLLAIAAFFPARKPILAGVAAGILTIKPQFGILIPIAYLAAGCWRSFFTAGIVAISLAAVTTFIFDPSIWLAFRDAVTTHGGRLQSDLFPFYKVISPYGGLVKLGLPTSVAIAAQLTITVIIAGAIATIWRRSQSDELRTIALCSAAAISVPYAFYYEFPIFVVPLYLIAKRAIESEWLPFEKIAIALLWGAPLIVTSGETWPISFAAITAASVFALCIRRVFHEIRPAPA